MKAIANEKLTGKEESSIHKFELAGLGKAPFRFTGEVEIKVYVACPGAPAQPSGTCDYCGTCIKYAFHVRSSDDKSFVVGCDCIHKTGDSGLVKQISVAERKIRDEKNKRAKELKVIRAQNAKKEALEMIGTVAEELRSKKHPSNFYSERGLTFYDYMTWKIENYPLDAFSYLKKLVSEKSGN